MKLLLDHAGMLRLLFCAESIEPGRRRLYFTAVAPARSVIVFHHGLDPTALTGAVVDAEIGHEIGSSGYVRAGNEGLQHSTLSFYQRVNGPPDNTLSRLLADGQQDEL